MNRQVIYGFSPTPNMSYSFGDESKVRENIQKFLRDNRFSNEEKLTNLIPAHENRIVILNDPELAGGEIETDSMFTKVVNTPLSVKPADCAILSFSFKHDEEQWIGIVHIGFEDYLSDMIKTTHDFLNNQFHQIKHLQIRVAPFLKKYWIEYLGQKNSKYNWDTLPELAPFLVKNERDQYIDFHSAVKTELQKFWSDNEIDFTDVQDTWELGKHGKGFSHQLSYFHPEYQNGRMIVCMEIVRKEGS